MNITKMKNIVLLLVTYIFKVEGLICPTCIDDRCTIMKYIQCSKETMKAYREICPYLDNLHFVESSFACLKLHGFLENGKEQDAGCFYGYKNALDGNHDMCYSIRKLCNNVLCEMTAFERLESPLKRTMTSTAPATTSTTTDMTTTTISASTTFSPKTRATTQIFFFPNTTSTTTEIITPTATSTTAKTTYPPYTTTTARTTTSTTTQMTTSPITTSTTTSTVPPQPPTKSTTTRPTTPSKGPISWIFYITNSTIIVNNYFRN